jgi:hypothetical protein
MNLIQESKGWNWKMDDAAGLYISGTGSLTEALPQLLARRISHSGIVESEVVSVQVADMNFMAAGLFGPGRGTGNIKWTGDAYKFAVYQCGRRAIVIMRTDGSGTRFYYLDDLISREIWEYFTSTLTTEMLWNVCRQIIFAYEEGRDHAKKEAYDLFVEGRLKKRKRKGRVYVEVSEVSK